MEVDAHLTMELSLPQESVPIKMRLVAADIYEGAKHVAKAGGTSLAIAVPLYSHLNHQHDAIVVRP